jgi:CubicO group peptidase (beta-lactamase class C family)
MMSIVAILTAWPASAAELPQTAAGKRVAAYLEAFNSGDEQLMRRFFEANVASDALERRSVDERLQIYHQMHDRLQSLELHEVRSNTDTAIVTLMHSGSDDWSEITFLFDNTPDHMFVGARIEDVTPPSVAEAQPRTPLTQPELVNTLDKYLDSLVEADAFSGVVLLAHDGAPFYSKTCGMANKEFDAPVRLDTKFNLGSINKVFTKTAIYQLVDQEELSLDDRLGKWLPDYPNKDAREKVTIGHLLDMTSGIGDFFGERFEATPKDRIRTIDDYLKLFSDAPLQFEPGTSKQYSNGGYIVLGAIIEKVSGKSYYDYVRENIFLPAGMMNTDSYMADAHVPNLAAGYTREHMGAGVPEGERLENIYTRPARGSSAGGGYSTAQDLLKFAVALKEGRFGSASAPESESNGGLGIAGGAPGINALLDADFQTGYSSIVMSNYDPPAAERVGRKIRDLLARLTM